MTTLRSYPEYKPSGIDWLGDIPNHWGLRKIKLMGRIKSGEGITSFGIEDEGTFPVYGGNGIRGYSETYTHEGDYLLVGRQGALCGNVHRVSGRFWASEHAIVVTPFSGVNVDWFGSVLQEMDLNQYYISAAQPGLAVERVTQVAAPLPPLSEQRVIAGFLDAMDEKITRFIAARRRMIALLEEQKQAIITQAVTRGLDPDVPLKPSGIDWLGDIPVHWEVKQSRYVFREIDARAPDDSLPRLSMSQKHGLVPTDRVESWRMQSESGIGAKVADAGDLVLNRLKAHLAVFAMSPSKGTVSPDYTVLRPSRDVCVRYFEALYRTPMYRAQFFIRTKGIVEGFWRLYTDSFYAIPAAIPPLSEQQAIVKHLDAVAADTSQVSDRAKREIELMQEYRTRLISDVVTGKLDVRGVELPAVKAVIGEEIEQAMEDQLADQTTHETVR